MDECLIERFYSLLDVDQASDLRDVMLAFPTPTFLQMFNQAVIKWGTTNPGTRTKNREAMTQAWHPNKGMMKLWRHLKRCATFANYAGEPIPDSQLRDAALLVINRSRAYNQAYLDFKREANQTFTNVKRFFNLREADRMEVMDEAGEHGYGMHATSGDPLDNDAATREL